MALSDKVRQIVREHYQFNCGFCGGKENDIGGELEIDHFQPVSQGGGDELANLVYACTVCNRYKENYWPGAKTPLHLHLLHPLQDDISSHISLSQDGKLIALSPRGSFHIEWLRLNRIQLVKRRQKEVTLYRLRQEFAQLVQANQELRRLAIAQEEELLHLRARLQLLLGDLEQ